MLRDLHCVVGSVSIKAGTRSRAHVSELPRPALGTLPGCSGPRAKSTNWQLLCSPPLLQSLFHNHHPPPHNHKTNFPHCHSKTGMEETVVVANECFSKTCCTKPSAPENSNEDQMESFSLMCFALLIKGTTTDILDSLNRNLWTHFGHCSSLFLFFLRNIQPGRQEIYF